MIYTDTQVAAFDTVEKLDAEIKRLQELYSNMVGQLYPPIVLEEIGRLNQRRREIEDADLHRT